MSAATLVFASLTVILFAVLICAVSAVGRYGALERRKKTEAYAELNARAKQGQTVFVGDSITEGYKVDEYYSDYAARTGRAVYNRGISAETSDEMLLRFENNVLSIEPSNLVILMGTNDLGKKTPPKVAAGNVTEALKLTREKCPETKIILQAVYPVNRGVSGKLLQLVFGGGRTRESIAELNSLLEKAAGDYGALWLDLSAPLSNENGELRTEFTTDGLHLNQIGYGLVTEYILPLLSQSKK